MRALIYNSLIDPSVLRLLWSIADNLSVQDLIALPDTEICTRILREVEQRLPLSPDQYQQLVSYLDSHILLIRDLAEAA